VRAILYHWQLGLCDDIQAMKSAQGLYAPWALALTASRLCWTLQASPSSERFTLREESLSLKRANLSDKAACKDNEY